MIRPVTAIITFFPTNESHSSHNRVVWQLHSRVDDRLGRAHRLGGLEELLTFSVGELHLDDPLEAASPQLAGNSTEDIAETKLALQPGRAGQDPLLVERNRLDHLHRRGTRGVVRRAGLEKANDLGAAIAGSSDDGVELLPIHQLVTGMPET